MGDVLEFQDDDRLMREALYHMDEAVGKLMFVKKYASAYWLEQMLAHIVITIEEEMDNG